METGQNKKSSKSNSNMNKLVFLSSMFGLHQLFAAVSSPAELSLAAVMCRKNENEKPKEVKSCELWVWTASRRRRRRWCGSSCVVRPPDSQLLWKQTQPLTTSDLMKCDGSDEETLSSLTVTFDPQRVSLKQQ